MGEKTAASYLTASLVCFMIGRFVGTALMSRFAPTRLMASFAAMNICLTLIAALVGGQLGLYALVATSLFMSIMFPTIFANSLRELGPLTKTASSFLVMAIIGGAVLTAVMGMVSDASAINFAILVPTVCFNCEAACGLTAFVDKQTLEIRKLEGNPLHPGSRGRNCAKGPATLNQVQDPERILYPLRRVGERGGGQWERVTWDEVLDDIGGRIRKALVEGRQKEVMYHLGRPGHELVYLQRVFHAWGIDGHNSHTNVCSASARAGYAFWHGMDRPSPDHARARFILLLSSHLETGHYFNPHAQRIMEAKQRGAKVCVLDTRLSNTASMADYWLSPWPGSEAAILLAMAALLVREGLHDREFVAETASPCLLIKPTIVTNFGPLDERFSSLQAAIVHFMASGRRCGFRTVLCNRAVVSLSGLGCEDPAAPCGEALSSTDRVLLEQLVPYQILGREAELQEREQVAARAAADLEQRLVAQRDEPALAHPADQRALALLLGHEHARIEGAVEPGVSLRLAPVVALGDRGELVGSALGLGGRRCAHVDLEPSVTRRGWCRA